MLSIGALSKATGVKVPTIRYYEQVGLIDAPERTEGNQRRYRRTDLERLEFIRHARDLGMALDAIGDLIALSTHPERPCAEAHQIAGDHLRAVRARMAQLRRLESELERIASRCDGARVGNCYVLRALSDHGLCDEDHGTAENRF